MPDIHRSNNCNYLTEHSSACQIIGMQYICFRRLKCFIFMLYLAACFSFRLSFPSDSAIIQRTTITPKYRRAHQFLQLALPVTPVNLISIGRFKSIGTEVARKAGPVLSSMLKNNAFNRLSVAWKSVALLVTALIYRAKLKFKKEIVKASNQMESGWFKRGYGSSFSRTIEVWSFAISFAFKWVMHDIL